MRGLYGKNLYFWAVPGSLRIRDELRKKNKRKNVLKKMHCSIDMQVVLAGIGIIHHTDK